jgi:CIC family chloride channel protein
VRENGSEGEAPQTGANQIEFRAKARHPNGHHRNPFVSGQTSFLRGLLDRYQPPEALVMLVTALVVGSGTGLGATIFRWLINQAIYLSFTWLPEVTSGLGRSYVVLAPAVGGAIIGPLIYFLAREAKGHGVPEVMEAVALHGGRIRPIVVVVKLLASSICIGSGGSVGRAGPIVQIGSALGSTLGQMLHLSDERVRNLVACGAAGGIAATFNAPIAGVFFAQDSLQGEFTVGSFGSVVLSSVMSSIIGHIAFGDVPAFAVPSYAIHSLWEFPLYAVLGVLAALTALVYTRLIYRSEDLFDSWRAVPEWVKPAIGGALLGLLALVYSRYSPLDFATAPQVYGVGYETIEGALLGILGLKVVLALLALKIISTSLTLGSGGSGGVFAPALFIGSMLGAGFGLIVARLFPGLVAPPGAYALVAMGAVFAGATHAPISAVIILFELTGDYRIILPLMLAVVTSTLLARHLLRGESIYTLKLSRRGVRLSSGRDVDVMQGVLVEEAMTHQVDTVPATMNLRDLLQEFNRTRHHGFPVLDEEGKLYGMVTLQDLERALQRHVSPDTQVREIATTEDLLVAYPDEPMSDALRRITVRGLGRLPVVSRSDPRQLLGTVRSYDIITAYNIALTRRAEVQHRTAQIRMRKVDNTEFVEIDVDQGAPCVGQTVETLSQTLPYECVLISIRRASGQIIIPHGDTVFRPGDRVTAFVESQAAPQLHHCLLESKKE